MNPIDDLETGSHFWATIDGQLLMVIKAASGYYVCGEWDAAVNENELQFIQLVDLPEGYTADDLYYNY